MFKLGNGECGIADSRCVGRPTGGGWLKGGSGVNVAIRGDGKGEMVKRSLRGAKSSGLRALSVVTGLGLGWVIKIEKFEMGAVLLKDGMYVVTSSCGLSALSAQ